MTDYHLVQSQFIEQNLKDITLHAAVAYEKFNKIFGTSDSTWTYEKYNIFCLASPSSFFYKIFLELRTIIMQICPADEIWMQAWMNYLSYDQLNRLDWHGHEYEYHGYICLDPKNTVTNFGDYQIENKSGQIYIGPGHRLHKVEAVEPFEGFRTTIGFDLVLNKKTPLVNYKEMPWLNMGFIPVA